MSDMRADFEAAIESSDIDETELQETEQEIIQPVEEVPEGDVSSEGEGKATNLDPAEQSPSEHSETIAAKDGKSEEKTPNENDSLKAPVDWSPKQREDWSKVPRHLQDKIVARENEMAQAMAGTAEARKVHDHVAKLGQSYGAIIAAEGVNTPIEAIDGLFRTVAELRMGTPAQKAQKIAQMIGHYGVDIQALDSALVGQPVKEQPNQQLEQIIDQRMAPINSVMQQLATMQQQKAQTVQTNANNAVVEFAKEAEFLPDVRNDMADLIDMAAKHGRTMTMQEAYDRACALNPEINTVIEERKRQENLMGASTTLAGKKAAASSLNGRQSGAGGSVGGGSLRATLLDAWDETAQG